MKQFGVQMIDHSVTSQWWRSIIKHFIRVGDTFEIRCWREETAEIQEASLYGTAIDDKYEVSIKEIDVYTNTLPTSGKIIFTQTGYRARGSISRDIEAEFTIYDVSRSESNAHGAKIEDWIVRYSEPIENNDNNQNPQINSNTTQ